MIYFKNVRWKNLLSTGDTWTEITLCTDQITLINGENGAGKTTMLDAITYALYNRPFRNINKPQLVNSINKKNMLVELEFSIGNQDFKICRGIKPSIFEIWKNNQLINQDAAARDYQEYLENHILRLNHKSFCQVVILGSTSFVPFMQLKSADRRQIIEDLLQLEIFTTMNVLLKEKISNNSSTLRENEYQHDLTSEKLSMTEQHVEELRKGIDVQIKEKSTYIDNMTTRISSEQQKIDDNETLKKQLISQCPEPKKVKERLDKIKQLRHQLDSKVSTITKDIEFFRHSDNCPTCRREIDDTFKQTSIEERQQTLGLTNDGLKQLEEQYERAQEAIEKVEEAQSQISEININNSAIQSTITAIKQQIDQTNSEIAALVEKQRSMDADDTTIKKLENLLASLAKQKKKLLEEKEVMNVTAMMLKDSGIKSRIIKQYIPIINKLINKYLAAMDFFVQFELDETFSETIKSRFRDAFSYDSFSEGEKTRINLAILFAWRAIAKLRNSASTNLLIFDEVLDSSTDQAGIEAFFNIIREIATDSNVFVISHTQEQYESRFDKTIKFKKVKNFSRMVA